VAVTVADTGPGIPRHALKKVFDDFYRVEDALTRTTGGTGIGLSLVKKFMPPWGATSRLPTIPDRAAPLRCACPNFDAFVPSV
jgi:signal transduction histidine kinase